jgi:hypothetical protein
MLEAYATGCRGFDLSYVYVILAAMGKWGL